MIEGDRRFEALNSNPRFRTQYQQEIYEGLALHEARVVSEIPKSVYTDIISKIESNFVDLSRTLSIPVPEIGLTMSWSGEPYIQILAQDRIEEIIAQAAYDESSPSGIVRYSPLYLKSLIKRGMGQEVEIEHPIEGVTAHEGFHIWQYIHQPEQIKRDFLIALREGVRGFNLTRTELEAVEFQKDWLKSHYKPQQIAAA